MKQFMLFLVTVATVSLALVGLFPPKAMESDHKSTEVYTKPVKPTDFYKTTVMIMNNKQNSGGSGVIYKSTDEGSYILTNGHVCEVVKNGGVIKTLNYDVDVLEYTIYEKHDLCMIKVGENLKINTKISDKTGGDLAEATQAGHPALLPLIVEHGMYSGYMSIKVMVGVDKCTGEEKDDEEIFYCIFYGKKPKFRTFDSQIVTSKVLPGSSGSAIFNKEGEITNFVFAGSNGGFSYAFTVPTSYIKDFVNNINNCQWKKVGEEPEEQVSNIEEIFNFVKIRKKYKILPAIWSEKWNYL